MKIALLYPTTPDAATKAYSIYPNDWSKEDRLLSIRLVWPEMNSVTTCATPYPKRDDETADFVSRMLSAAVASDSNLIVVSRSEVVYRRLRLHLAQGARLDLSVYACSTMDAQENLGAGEEIFAHSREEQRAIVSACISMAHQPKTALDRFPRIATREVRYAAVMKVDEQIKNGEGE